jgi:hypothetical protein
MAGAFGEFSAQAMLRILAGAAGVREALSKGFFGWGQQHVRHHRACRPVRPRAPNVRPSRTAPGARCRCGRPPSVSQRSARGSSAVHATHVRCGSSIG